MRGASSHRCADRRTGFGDGGEAVTPTLQVFLIVSAALFSAGLLAALTRRPAIFIMIWVKMLLSPANSNLIASLRFRSQILSPSRVLITVFLISIVAPYGAVL